MHEVRLPPGEYLPYVHDSHNKDLVELKDPGEHEDSTYTNR
jgi:hypothetical protein